MAIGKEYVIIGVVNIIFIAVVIILIFVDIPSYVTSIVSAIFLLLSSILAFYFLTTHETNNNNNHKSKNGDIEMGMTKTKQAKDRKAVYRPSADDSQISDENQPIIPSSTTTNNKRTSGEYDNNLRWKDKYDKLNKDYDQIMKEYDEKKKIHETTVNELQDSRNDNSKLIKKWELLQQELDSKENEVKILNNTILDKDQETNNSKEQLNKLQQDYNLMSDKLETLQQKVADHDDLKHQLDSMKASADIIAQQIEQYESRIEQLQLTEQELQQERHNNKILRQSIDELQNEVSQYKSKTNQIHKSMAITPNSFDNDNYNDNYNNNINNMDDINDTKDQIDKLKKELAHAQKTIIEMTSVVGVQQTFPTVQETIQQYRSIRDQKHHDTSTLLKKFIKKNCNSKWQKYYINQVIHEIMFDILLKCYKLNEEYRLQIYDNIADQLNMKHAIADAFEINKNQINENYPQNIKIIKKQQTRLLSNIFGAYFKNNFKHVLQKRLISNNNNNNNEEKDNNNNNNDSLIDEVINYIKDKYSEFKLNELGQDEINGLKEYIIECSQVCWVMILQDPPLHIHPSKWRNIKQNENENEENENQDNESKDNPKIYDERYHKRVLGSDRNCKSILYHVWPAVARNGTILGDQKIDVVLRNELYTPFKIKRGSVASTVSTTSNIDTV